jgi:ornithine cyclodeaminase/alanine dehydrogenase-like protein (mu-crystallin family)
MTLVLRAEDLRRAVDPAGAVEAVAAGVREAAGSPGQRINVPLPTGWIRLMGGCLPDSDVLGFKAFHLVQGHGVRYLTALYRLSTGEPLALADANELTVLRTSAAAAAAAKAFWGDAEIRVGVVGSSVFARSGFETLRSVCRVREARVYSPTAARREAFAVAVGASAVPAPDELAPSDMLLCCTATEGEVAVERATVDGAAYVSSVGSTMPSQREVDARVVGDAAVVVVDSPQTLEESGDAIAAAQAGLLDERRVVPLAAFLAEPVRPEHGYVLYKSVGSVEQDLAVAAYAVDRARALGLGEEIAEVESLRGRS